MTALLALESKYLRQEGLSPEAIKGVIAISGVYDLADFYEPGVVPSRMEQGFGTDREILRDASPSLKVGEAWPCYTSVSDHLCEQRSVWPCRASQDILLPVLEQQPSGALG